MSSRVQQIDMCKCNISNQDLMQQTPCSRKWATIRSYGWTRMRWHGKNEEDEPRCYSNSKLEYFEISIPMEGFQWLGCKIKSKYSTLEDNFKNQCLGIEPEIPVPRSLMNTSSVFLRPLRFMKWNTDGYLGVGMDPLYQ